MFRRILRRLDRNVYAEAPSWRSNVRNEGLMVETILQSPYKESMKEYWATPVAWSPREYGRKPRVGEPAPCRQASSLIIAAKNNHIDPSIVASGEENDYKVLFMHREARGRYQKDNFLIPSNPTTLSDREYDWVELLERLKVTTKHEDLTARITAIRALLVECNILVLPPEGGGLAEVEGPPGFRKWQGIVQQIPSQLRNLIDILEIPYESALTSLLPFRTVVTPTTESFRYNNAAYIVPFDKMPDVRFTISMKNEQLIWISPREVVNRFNAGVLEMPTPNVIMMSELANEFHTYDLIKEKLKFDQKAPIIQPELVHDENTNMATVLLPGDLHHSKTEADLVGGSAAGAGDESATERPPFLRRFQYIKDDPWGVRAVFFQRPVTAEDDLTPLKRVEDYLVKEDDEMMKDYKAQQLARRSQQDPDEVRQMPRLSLIDDQTQLDMAERQKMPIEEKLKHHHAIWDDDFHKKKKE